MECEQKRHIFKCHFETFCVDSAKNHTILPKGEVGESGVSAVRYPKRDVFLRYVKNEGGFYLYAICT